jgi:coproporphyrinogen III oxidase-like Fe-S oxidoreductase
MAATRLERERDLYARAVAALGHAEPSSLLAQLEQRRTRRFSARELVERWGAAGARATGARHLYLHVPFCKSICTFCNYKRLRVSSPAALEEYVAFIEAEARLFAPAFAGLGFEALYVGGGTPSVLAADQLERVLGALHEAFTFAPDAQKTFEFDPMVMTDDRHRVVSSFGFRRFSFGIQSVDVSINRLHNRGAQGKGHIDKQFDLLRAHDAFRANVDFLLGLAGTTPGQMLEEIVEVMKRHAPAEIAVYFIQPTHEYLARHFDGDPARYREFLAAFEAQVPERLPGLAAGAGYSQVGGGSHAMRFTRDAPTLREEGTASYCDVPAMAHRPLFLLGLGDSARSRIFGDLVYRAEHDHADSSPGAQRYLGADLTLGDELFAYLSFVLRDDDVVSRPLFERTFGAASASLLAEPLAKLGALGVARVEPDAIRFGSQRREERLRDLLFFLPRERRAELALPSSAPAAVPIRQDEVERAVAPLGAGAAVAPGWEIGRIHAAGVTLRRADPLAEVLVKLFKPAGSRPAWKSTARYDVQYQIAAGSAAEAELDAPLGALVAAIRKNELT